MLLKLDNDFTDSQPKKVENKRAYTTSITQAERAIAAQDDTNDLLRIAIQKLDQVIDELKENRACIKTFIEMIEKPSN